MAVPAPVRRALRRLERYCPLDRPARLYLLRQWPGYWGQTWAKRGERHLEAYLCPPAWSDVTVDTVFHEWAHAMCWSLTRVDHGEVWGSAYSRCYRVVVEGWQPDRPWRPRTSRAAARRR